MVVVVVQFGRCFDWIYTREARENGDPGRKYPNVRWLITTEDVK